jgi:hypothetical protein
VLVFLTLNEEPVKFTPVLGRFFGFVSFAFTNLILKELKGKGLRLKRVSRKACLDIFINLNLP